jgi:predicted nucleic acid-binding protein
VTRIAVIDTGPLINLIRLDLAMKLALFFQTIYVPREVQLETNRRHKRRQKLAKLFGSGVFKRCVVGDEVGVQLLTRELQRGEAEALTQAQENGALFFIVDEDKARNIANRRGLRPLGTCRILARLNLDGHAGDPRALIAKLQKEEEFWISEDVIDAAITAAPTPFY